MFFFISTIESFKLHPKQEIHYGGSQLGNKTQWAPLGNMGVMNC